MKLRFPRLVSVFAGVSLIAISAQAAQAASASGGLTELIVRYRDPQTPESSAIGARAAEAKSAQLVDAPSGVVKLRFESHEAAKRARLRLELAGSAGKVESVAYNHLYRPAIHYRARDAAAPSPGYQPFFTLPFENPLAATEPVGLPTVRQPGASTAGVDPLAASDWALRSIRMPEFAPLDAALPGASPVIAAVIDTGVDYNHEDLVGAMWRKPGQPTEVGYDFAHKSALPYDVVHFDIEGCVKSLGCGLGLDQGKFLTNAGHGTHCAGHVGAVANNSLGIQGVSANRARVMALKFFYDAEDEHAGRGDDAAAIQSIDYAIRNGAKVISASWSGRIDRAEAEASELKQALIRAQKAGVLVVVAAGNDAADQDEVEDPSYPAAYDLDNLIVVAATDPEDKLGDFSSYGAKSVHLAAPGVKILSTTSGGRYDDVIAKFKDARGKDQQLDWDGTSMATPIVAGAVAAVWAKYPNEDYRSIRARILGTARAVPGLTGKVQTGGVLDVAAALGGG